MPTTEIPLNERRQIYWDTLATFNKYRGIGIYTALQHEVERRGYSDIIITARTLEIYLPEVQREIEKVPVKLLEHTAMKIDIIQTALKNSNNEN